MQLFRISPGLRLGNRPGKTIEDETFFAVGPRSRSSIIAMTMSSGTKLARIHVGPCSSGPAGIVFTFSRKYSVVCATGYFLSFAAASVPLPAPGEPEELCALSFSQRSIRRPCPYA